MLVATWLCPQPVPGQHATSPPKPASQAGQPAGSYCQITLCFSTALLLVTTCRTRLSVYLVAHLQCIQRRDQFTAGQRDWCLPRSGQLARLPLCLVAHLPRGNTGVKRFGCRYAAGFAGERTACCQRPAKVGAFRRPAMQSGPDCRQPPPPLPLTTRAVRCARMWSTRQPRRPAAALQPARTPGTAGLQCHLPMRQQELGLRQG